MGGGGHEAKNGTGSPVHIHVHNLRPMYVLLLSGDPESA